MKRPAANRVWLNAILVAVGAAAAVLGTAKTVTEAVTGTAFSVGDLAYYTGSVAMAAYYGVAALVLVLVATLMLDERVHRGRQSSDTWNLLMAAAPILAGLAAVAYAVLTFEWDPDAAGQAMGLVTRLVGLAAVVGAVIAYRRPRHA